MDSASRHLMTKFGLLDQMLRELEESGKNPKLLQESRETVDAIRARHALTTSWLYIRAAEGETGKKEASVEYRRILGTEGFERDLDQVAQQLEKQQRSDKRGGRSGKAGTLAEQFWGVPGGWSFLEVDNYRRCEECQEEMTIDTATSELRCPRCGRVCALGGTAFDDAQFFNQEGQKAKSGTFNFNRHHKSWIDHILAQESETELGDPKDPDNLYGEKLIEALRTRARERGKKIRLLTVTDVRKMLQAMGRTDLNKNVALILKKLTGVGPPLVPEHYLVKEERIFNEAIRIRELVKNHDRQNRSYYPYYIYKIFDAIIPEAETETRRILFYINLQGDTTVDNNDEEWELICDRIPEITPVSTNRSLALKHLPL